MAFLPTMTRVLLVAIVAILVMEPLLTESLTPKLNSTRSSGNNGSRNDSRTKPVHLGGSIRGRFYNRSTGYKGAIGGHVIRRNNTKPGLVFRNRSRPGNNEKPYFRVPRNDRDRKGIRGRVSVGRIGRGVGLNRTRLGAHQYIPRGGKGVGLNRTRLGAHQYIPRGGKGVGLNRTRLGAHQYIPKGGKGVGRNRTRLGAHQYIPKGGKGGGQNGGKAPGGGDKGGGQTGGGDKGGNETGAKAPGGGDKGGAETGGKAPVGGDNGGGETGGGDKGGGETGGKAPGGGDKGGGETGSKAPVGGDEGGGETGGKAPGGNAPGGGDKRGQNPGDNNQGNNNQGGSNNQGNNGQGSNNQGSKSGQGGGGSSAGNATEPDCKKKGGVCGDPQVVGGDGRVYYFYGRRDRDFCLVSDPDLHINAHFIGTRPLHRAHDSTWVQSLAFFHERSTLTIAAERHLAHWSPEQNHLRFTYNNQPLNLTTSWTSGSMTLTRNSPNSVEMEIEGKMKVAIVVVPVAREANLRHKYEVPEDVDCFAHLDMQFTFWNLTPEVDGVLGQTYRRVNRSVAVEEAFQSSSLLATDCASSRFTGGGVTAATSTSTSGKVRAVCTSSGFLGHGLRCHE